MRRPGECELGIVQRRIAYCKRVPNAREGLRDDMEDTYSSLNKLRRSSQRRDAGRCNENTYRDMVIPNHPLGHSLTREPILFTGFHGD